LESPADRTGLVNLLKATYLQSGELTVVAQSQERLSGRQFLNRSLIEALNQVGVDVNVALEPGPGGGVGTIIVDTTEPSRRRAAGGSSASRVATDAGQVQRFLKLQEAEEILSSTSNS
jgi:hypothetical protein